MLYININYVLLKQEYREIIIFYEMRTTCSALGYEGRDKLYFFMRPGGINLPPRKWKSPSKNFAHNFGAESDMSIDGIILGPAVGGPVFTSQPDGISMLKIYLH